MIHRHDDGAEAWMVFFTDNESRPLAIMALVKAAELALISPISAS
jgi:hypothetical protein